MIVSINVGNSVYERGAEVLTKTKNPDGSFTNKKTGLRVKKIYAFLSLVVVIISNGEKIVFHGHPYNFVTEKKR